MPPLPWRATVLSMQVMMQRLFGARHFVTHGLGGSWLPSVAVLRWVTVPGKSVTGHLSQKGLMLVSRGLGQFSGEWLLV